MIFLVLGTQKFQLNRLLKEMDKLCGTGKVTDIVYAQKGYSEYQPKNYEYVDFLNKDEFEKTIAKSSLIITHSGVGSIITAIQSGKPVIVYPRLCKYKEHVDDHQLEIAEAFEKKNFVLCCKEKEDLGKVIDRARSHVFDKYEPATGNIINLVSTFLEKI